MIVPPVKYCYDAARSQQAELAWKGIQDFGPFSRSTFSKRSPNILVVFPDTAQGAVEKFIRYLRDGIRPAFAGGLAKLFSLANPTFSTCKVGFLGQSGAKPGLLYKQALEATLRGMETQPDAAIVVLSDEHALLPDPDGPYIQSKSFLMLAGIPTQKIRLSKLSLAEQQLQYVLQNISTAMYAKLNGTPWTVDQDKTVADEPVIGMGTSELLQTRVMERERFVGITTVFRGDGNYLLGHISKECAYSEYAEVLQSSTTTVLEDIKSRNGWMPGDRVRIIFHSSKPFRNVEVAEIAKQCVATVGKEQTVEFAFLTVTLDHPFVVFDPDQKGIEDRYGRRPPKGVMVPERGTILEIGRYTRLLCTNGPRLIKLEKAPLPSPLLVSIHKESDFVDLAYLSEQVLKFTSLSWRSTLPAKKPVSIYYSELIAELLARLRKVPGWSPDALNIKLRASRWFL